MSADPSFASSDREAWDRLAADLDSLSGDDAALETRTRLLDRIASEPARVETDAAGAVTAVNPAFIDLCGYTFAEIRGRKPGQLLQGPLTDPAIVTHLRHAIAAGVSCEADLVNYHKDGSPYRVHITLDPVHDEHGALAAFRAVEIKLPL